MTIRLHELSFAYPRSERALRSVSLVAAPGAFVAVVGPNGAGKSTLLRLAAGLLRPQSGAAEINGAPAHRLSPRTRAERLAYIAQRPTVAGGFTTREVVALGRFALRRDAGAVDRALDAVRLADRADAVFNQLSAGQQQRAAIARALAQVNAADAAGRCILADEPISALDPAHASIVLKLLFAFTRRGGTVLASLHDLTAALRWADQTLVLRADGSPVGFGPSAQTLRPEPLRAAFGADFAIGEVAGARIVVPLDRLPSPLPPAADTMTPDP